mmetsp:Transcript_593/g.1188  ORF Transcript_593/g.1188 Transcript_593/m.1188 type:complete len:101 (-) Transcript_593:610-912(-)
MERWWGDPDGHWCRPTNKQRKTDGFTAEAEEEIRWRVDGWIAQSSYHQLKYYLASHGILACSALLWWFNLHEHKSTGSLSLQGQSIDRARMVAIRPQAVA